MLPNLAKAAMGLASKSGQKKSTAVGSVAPHSHDSSKDTAAPIPPVSNITGNANQNSKIEELGKQFFHGDQFANQYASRPPVDPAMPVPPQPDPINDQYGNMFMQPFSKKVEGKEHKQKPNRHNELKRKEQFKGVNMIGGVKKAKDPKSKYRHVGVQYLQEKGKIFDDEKGPYVVNKELTGTSRDTLRLPSNVWRSPGEGLIDDGEYMKISNEVNKVIKK